MNWVRSSRKPSSHIRNACPYTGMHISKPLDVLTEQASAASEVDLGSHAKNHGIVGLHA
jgi:hypothetical protein